MKPAHPPAPGPLRVPPAAAAAALVAAGLLLAGCPPSGNGNGSPAPGAAPSAEAPLDPAVKEALARRPDLAKSRVLVLGMDGLDPDLMRTLVARGKLPNFKRLGEEGTAGPIRTQQPTLSPLLWTSIATGKFPTEHGVLDFMVRDDSDPSKRTTVTSAHRQVEAMWDIAGRYGRTVGLVGWLASHPAEKVNGFAVSERTEPLAYLYREKPLATDEGKTFPADLMQRVRALRRPSSEYGHGELAPFLDITEEEFRKACTTEEFTDENRANDVRLVYAAAENFRRIGTALYRERRPDLFCMYLEELDAVSHFCMAYRDPVTWKPLAPEEIVKRVPDMDLAMVREICRKVRGEDPGGPAVVVPKEKEEVLSRVLEMARGAEPEKVRRLGRAVDAAYEHSDRILGEVMGLLDADSVLVVVSDHGFAFGAGKPPYDSSFRSRLGGASYHRDDGFLAFFGKGVKKGKAFPEYDSRRPGTGARLVDVCPTVLALLGFPKAKDMPGRVLAEAFDLDLSTGTVPTYERGRAERLARERVEKEERRRLSGGEDPTEEGALDDAMRQLIAVGYVGTAEEGPVRAVLHMAASFLEQDRLEEAEEAFREALKSAKGQPRMSALYALGRLLTKRGKLDEAEAMFRQALADRKGFVPALSGLASILEKKGDPVGAVPLWEEIVRQEPANPLFKICLADSIREASNAAPGPRRAEDLDRAIALIREAALPRAAEGEEDRLFEAQKRNYLGMALLDSGRVPEAIEEFTASAGLNPRFVKPRNNLGVACMRLSSLDFQAAAESTDPQGQGRLVRSAAGQREEALRWFDESLGIDPGNAKARYNRAEIFFLLPPRDLAAAEKEAALALEADPDYKRARRLLDSLRARAKPGTGGGERVPR